MAPELDRVEDLFCEALEIGSADDRAAYLERACAGDAALRRQVESLLGAHSRAGRFLGVPAVPPGARLDDPGPAEEVGETIGPYRLLEAIGEGGMGTVYMAEQQAPVRRRVALKVVKPGMDTRQVIARFEAERQALALMDHPNIARVFDGGATGRGRPYFVMELVRGLAITEYCDREQLTVAERLDLFVQVCQAVQHAHQKGIIHRDLKPSNILVTTVDGAGVPKVIDFGVAKATGQNLTDRTLFTGFHQLVGTPLYMSPEQADLAGTDVDTRTDVYSLGVLLYELLTGTTPFEADTLRSAAFDEMRRIIREAEPQKPSSRLSTLGAERLSSVTALRRTDPRHLQRSVRGELDWIVLRAMEKDRRRRYQTVGDFAADVARHLRGEPVEACPQSAWYRWSKYARRNRAALTTAALVALALIAGTSASVWQARNADRAAAVATARAEETRQVVDYLVSDVFGAAVPNRGRRRSVTVGELLNQADATVGDRFRGQPLVEASVRMALARTYRGQFDGGRAEPHATRAAELRERILGPDHPETLQALAEQAFAHGDFLPAESRRDAVAANVRRVFEAHRRLLGPGHPTTLAIQVHFAAYLDRLKRFDEARVEAVEAEALAVRALGPEHPTTLRARSTLGWTVYHHGGDFAGAEALLRTGLEGMERVLGPHDPETIVARQSLIILEREEDRIDAIRPLALEQFRRSCELYGTSDERVLDPLGLAFVALHQQLDFAVLRRVYEDTFREVLATPVELDPESCRERLSVIDHLALYASVQPGPFACDRGLVARVLEQAVAVGERITAIDDAELGPGHADSLASRARLAIACGRLGRLGDGERLWRRSLEVLRGRPERKSSGTAYILTSLGQNLIQQRRYAEAESLLREALATSDDARPKSLLGEALAGRGRSAEAEPLLRQGYEHVAEPGESLLFDPHGRIELIKAADRLVRFYEQAGKPEAAAHWREQVERASRLPRPSAPGAIAVDEWSVGMGAVSPPVTVHESRATGV